MIGYDMKHIYNLEIFASKCIIEILMNDLLIFRADAKNGTSFTYPLNTELVGKNTLKIILYPVLLDSGLPSTPNDIMVEGAIKRYSIGDFTGPECGDLLSTIDIDDIKLSIDPESVSLKNLADMFPLNKSFQFENDEISFKDRIIDGTVIDNKDSIINYSFKILDIIKRQDLEAFWLEYKPKLDDYAIAYPHEFPDPKAWFVNFITTDFFPGGPNTEFKRDNIGLRSWCGGRIWEVFIKPYTPFFTNKGLDGDINSIEMFVGLVDGQLKIIR